MAKSWPTSPRDSSLVEMSRSRRRLLEMFGQVQLEQHLRRRAEEQFRALAEKQPRGDC